MPDTAPKSVDQLAVGTICARSAGRREKAGTQRRAP